MIGIGARISASSSAIRSLPTPAWARLTEPQSGHGRRQRLPVAAVVAGEPPRVPVDDERDVAFRAAPGAAAGAAAEVRGVTAPVDEDDRLAALGTQGLEGIEGAVVKGTGPPGSLAHVEDLHLRQRLGVHTLGQVQPLQLQPALRPGVSRCRRRGSRRRARRAGGRRGARRNEDRPPACRRRRAPRRRRSGRVEPTGANTAERGPTQIRASPLRRRRHSSARSPSESCEWIRATRSPKRSRKRPIVWGVSPISGTSTIAPSPRPSAAWTTAR